ncbi:MAG: hypothetical protein JWO03_2692 [Bacteroidetes bacterium]|nr:hypothetical protein [Bacteroidota bacterium]
MQLNDFVEILELEIPPRKKREVGFLEIIGQEYKENINSRVYCYFLDKIENKETAHLFLRGLLNIIKHKTSKKIEIEEFICLREEITNSDKRIDILICDEVNKCGIIIENKIYHYLANDLGDYWAHLNYASENKVGILLTLYPQDVPFKFKNDFINVTHREWIAEVENGVSSLQIGARKLIYLEDFINTIKQISQSETMNEEAQFYFEHVKQVNDAIIVYDQAYDYIIEQIQIVAEKLDWAVNGKKPTFWRNIWGEQHPNVYYTICFDDLFDEEREIILMIELYDDVMKEVSKLDEVLAGNEIMNNFKRGIKADSYLQYVVKTYRLDINDLNNFSTFVFDKIQQEFKPILDVIIQTLYQQESLV